MHFVRIFPAGEGEDDVQIVRRCVREDGGMLVGQFKTTYTSAYGQEREKKKMVRMASVRML